MRVLIIILNQVNWLEVAHVALVQRLSVIYKTITITLCAQINELEMRERKQEGKEVVKEAVKEVEEWEEGEEEEDNNGDEDYDDDNNEDYDYEDNDKTKIRWC